MNINKNLLVQVLDNFYSEIENFGINNADIFNELIFFLSKNGVKIKKDKIEISTYNKLNVALIAIYNGVDIVDIANTLDWHDFELFSSELLKLHGYSVYTNFRIKRPKREIDVIGIKRHKALLFDCKHWKRKSLTGLKQIVERQKNRSKIFLQSSKMDIENAFPIVLTFLPNNYEFIDGVPIVSINKLNSFLIDFDNLNQYLYKI